MPWNRGPAGNWLTICLLASLAACTPSPSSPVAPIPADDTPEIPRVRVLGTVQDGGLPHAACSCSQCGDARERPDRRRRISSLAVLAAEQAWLLDATPDIRDQLHAVHSLGATRPRGVDRAPVEGVFLTHAHLGHYTGLAFFGFEAVHTRKLPVYCTPTMAAFLRGNAPWSQLVDIDNIDLRELRPGVPVPLVDGVFVTPIRVPHRDELSDTVGFFIRGPAATVLYVPDTDSWRAWDPPLTARLEGVDIAILDGTFYSAEELPGRDVSEIGHPLIADSMDLLAPWVDDGRLVVYFTHLNHSNPALNPDSPQRRAVESRGFHILREDQELPL